MSKTIKDVWYALGMNCNTCKHKEKPANTSPCNKCEPILRKEWDGTFDTTKNCANCKQRARFKDDPAQPWCPVHEFFARGESTCNKWTPR